jgi:hypothetical protein
MTEFLTMFFTVQGSSFECGLRSVLASLPNTEHVRIPAKRRQGSLVPRLFPPPSRERRRAPQPLGSGWHSGPLRQPSQCASWSSRIFIGRWLQTFYSLKIIQALAIQHIDFDHDDALIQPNGCRYFSPCNAPWARTYRTVVRSQGGEIRQPAMKSPYGLLWKPAFR